MSRRRGERGRSQATLDLIESGFKIIQPIQPITVRGVAYKLFAAGLIDSMEKKNVQKVARVLKDAREEGRIPWEWIVDETRQLERQPQFSNLEEYARVIELAYRRDFWADQDKRVIVISEKSTVAGVLRPVLNAYGVPFFSCHGFNSATKVHELAEEIRADKRYYIFLYVGDYDPSGMYMSEVDFPERLRRYGADRFYFGRIALTLADCYDSLPSFDVLTKQDDPRFDWFVQRYGYDAWELDAMDPNELRDRVAGYIRGQINQDAWKRHKVAEEAQRRSTKMVAAQLAQMDGRA